MNEREFNRFYELGYILKDQSTESAVLDLLTKYKAEISVKRAAEKIRLAYEIKKENEGFFGFVQFFAEPKDISLLDKELKFMKDVLRFILVRAEEVKEEKATPVVTEAKEKEVSVGESPKLSPRPPSSSLSNEELKAKLQEIS